MRTPFGELRFGRMPSHWGIGMLVNNGDCLDCDYGANADRVMFATKLWGHFIAFMWDWVATGPTTQIIGPQQGQGVFYNADTARRRLAVDPRARQAWTSPRSSRRSSTRARSSSTTAATSSTASRTGTQTARPATPSGNTDQSLQNDAACRASAKAFIADIWLRLNWKKLHIEAEGAIIAGTIGNLTDIFAGGQAARRRSCRAASSSRPTTSCSTTRSRSSSRSATPRATTPRIRTRNVNYRFANLVPVNNHIGRFTFDPDYHVDLILFRRILGTVNNATYFKPGVSYDIVDNFGARVDLMYAIANNPVAYPGNSLQPRPRDRRRAHVQERGGGLLRRPRLRRALPVRRARPARRHLRRAVRQRLAGHRADLPGAPRRQVLERFLATSSALADNPRVARASTQFVCQHCGYAIAQVARPLSRVRRVELARRGGGAAAQPAGAVSSSRQAAADRRRRASIDAPRMPTGIGELDRVLGGGLVPGSLVLLGGDPGIGKSTLLLAGARRAGARAARRVLYVSGEESVQQTAMRAERLGVRTARAARCSPRPQLERILDEAERDAARRCSRSTRSRRCTRAALESIPGSLGQVREAAGRLLTFAKTSGVPMILVGHVTKDGGLAGPKTLEHVVDCGALLRGRAHAHYRILRATKNRFGSTNEIGVFEMRAEGLAEVPNPVGAVPRRAAGRRAGLGRGRRRSRARGRSSSRSRRWWRTPPAMPRRTALGIDPNRVSLLLAVIERRAGIDVLGQDVFVNVAGGVRLSRAGERSRRARGDGLVGARPADRSAHALLRRGRARRRDARGRRRELRLAEAQQARLPSLRPARAVAAQLHGKPELELVGVRDVGAALEALLG